MAVKVSHVHKLRRHKHKTGNSIYFCTLPDCTFKSSVSLSLGKRTLCWRCDEPFIMNEYSIRLAKPHCDKCHKPKEDGHRIEGNGNNAETHKTIIEDVKALSVIDKLNQTIKNQSQKIEADEDI